MLVSGGYGTGVDASPAATTTASAGFIKKNGGSRSLKPIFGVLGVVSAYAASVHGKNGTAPKYRHGHWSRCRKTVRVMAV